MTYAYHASEFAADVYLLNCSTCKTRFSTPLEIFEGSEWPMIFTWFSTLCMYALCNKIVYATSKSYKTMRMNMFIAYDKVKADTENIRGLNSSVLKLHFNC
jgi:hypothetical protein